MPHWQDAVTASSCEQLALMSLFLARGYSWNFVGVAWTPGQANERQRLPGCAGTKLPGGVWVGDSRG